MSETMPRKWIPFPIFVLQDNDGERALIPNDLQLRQAQKRLEHARSIYEKEKEVSQAKNEVEYRLMQVGLNEANVKQMEAVIAEFRDAPEIVVRDYRIAVPKFGAYLAAEDAAKDVVNMEATVNRGRLMVSLLAGNIQLDGNVLNEKEVREMEISEGLALFNELEPRCFNDPARLPFLNLSSVKSKEELSPTRTSTRRR